VSIRRRLLAPETEYDCCAGRCVVGARLRDHFKPNDVKWLQTRLQSRLLAQSRTSVNPTPSPAALSCLVEFAAVFESLQSLRSRTADPHTSHEDPRDSLQPPHAPPQPQNFEGQLRLPNVAGVQRHRFNRPHAQPPRCGLPRQAAVCSDARVARSPDELAQEVVVCPLSSSVFAWAAIVDRLRQTSLRPTEPTGGTSWLSGRAFRRLLERIHPAAAED
jgi:hypothetical protein